MVGAAGVSVCCGAVCPVSVGLGALRPRRLAASERVWSVVVAGVGGGLSGGGPFSAVVAVVAAGGLSGGGPSILAGGLFAS